MIAVIVLLVALAVAALLQGAQWLLHWYIYRKEEKLKWSKIDKR